MLLKQLAFEKLKVLEYALYPILGWIVVVAAPVLLDGLTTTELIAAVRRWTAVHGGHPGAGAREAEPVAADVRLSRDLAHLHGGGGGLPLRHHHAARRVTDVDIFRYGNMIAACRGPPPPPMCSTPSPNPTDATCSMRWVPTRSASTNWPPGCSLAQPQVSKHLKVLREVDLVRCRTVGRRRLYRVHHAGAAAAPRLAEPLRDRSSNEQLRPTRRPPRPDATGAPLMATRHGSAQVTLPSDREILITRHFEAPRVVVWRALTEPMHLLRWWGPPWCPMVTCEVDLRVGGAWRYVLAHRRRHRARLARRVPRDRARPTHRHHRGVRGLPRRRVGEHDDARRGRRGHHAAHARAARDTERTATATSSRAWRVACRSTFDRLDDLLRRSTRRPSASAASPRASPESPTACGPTSGTCRRRARAGSPATSSVTSSGWVPGVPRGFGRAARREWRREW